LYEAPCVLYTDDVIRKTLLEGKVQNS
jgi:hypothetical protein